LKIWIAKGNHYKSNETVKAKKHFAFKKVLECGSDNDRNCKKHSFMLLLSLKMWYH